MISQIRKLSKGIRSSFVQENYRRGGRTDVVGVRRLFSLKPHSNAAVGSAAAEKAGKAGTASLHSGVVRRWAMVGGQDAVMKSDSEEVEEEKLVSSEQFIADLFEMEDNEAVSMEAEVDYCYATDQVGGNHGEKSRISKCEVGWPMDGFLSLFSICPQPPIASLISLVKGRDRQYIIAVW